MGLTCLDCILVEIIQYSNENKKLSPKEIIKLVGLSHHMLASCCYCTLSLVRYWQLFHCQLNLLHL